MRHWAQAEYDSMPSKPRSKKSTKVNSGAPLQMLSTNNPRMKSRSPVNEDAPPVRLSRHIPQREGMDMAVSAYNLTTSSATSLVPSTAGGVSGLLSLPHSTGGSFSSHFSESIVSDDSSYMTSMYNGVLAEQLSTESTQKQRKIGGEVLGFNHTDLHRNCMAQAAPNGGMGRTVSGSVSPTDDDGVKHCEHHVGANSTRAPISPMFVHSPTGRAMLLKKIKPVNGPTQRVMFTTPERTLDAPEFPSNASQLLHWGANNKLVIGLKNGLHGWDAETANASQIVYLEENVTIRAVRWLDGCTCVALALDGGTLAIYDCRQVGFLRTLQVSLSNTVELSYMAANGPLLSVGTNSGAGGIHVFDLRAKNALISVYEGHANGVTSLSYCTREPFYLAAGHANGAVRVWDARHSNCPRYVFDNVHSGAVSAIQWDPDKRSRMYSGGQDGMMCYVDTHAPIANVPSVLRSEDEGSTGNRHFITRVINTMYPISGIIAPPGVGELATTHRGRGQIQLRQSGSLHLIGVLGSPNTASDITCPTIAPDMQRICTAQDELLKFWRVFWPSPQQRSETSTPPPPSLLEDELR